MKVCCVLFVIVSLSLPHNKISTSLAVSETTQKQTGAEQAEKYMSYLKGKQVAIDAGIMAGTMQ